MAFPQTFSSKKNSLKYGAIGGLLSFVGTLAIFPFELGLADKATPLYIIFVVIGGIGAGFFSYGFFVLGRHLNKRPLQKAGLLWIGLSVISTLVLLFTIPFEELWTNFFFSALIIALLGVGGIILGRGLRSIESSFDKSAKTLGALLIVAGISMVTLVFFILGTILLIVFDILGAMFLLRARKKIQAVKTTA